MHLKLHRKKVDVKPEETTNEFQTRIGKPGNMERVRINMIQFSCICNNDLTDINLEDISEDKNVHIDFQHELIDGVSAKSTSEINAMYGELRYTYFKEKVMKKIKKS